MQKRLVTTLVTVTLLGACSGGEKTADTQRGQPLYRAPLRHRPALYDRFTEQTGIQVNLIEGNADS